MNSYELPDESSRKDFQQVANGVFFFKLKVVYQLELEGRGL